MFRTFTPAQDHFRKGYVTYNFQKFRHARATKNHKPTAHPKTSKPPSKLTPVFLESMKTLGATRGTFLIPEGESYPLSESVIATSLSGFLATLSSFSSK